MPPFNSPASLHRQCNAQIADLLLDVLSYRIDVCQDIIELVERLPGDLFGKFFMTALNKYIERYSKFKCEKQTNHFLLKRNNHIRPLMCNFPCFYLFFEHLVRPPIVKLDLSGLHKFGPVTDDLFDEVDSLLSRILSRIPKVQELILKSHNSFPLLPKVMNSHLYIIGSNCLELEFLDISYNKSITSEGIKHLTNCCKLKKLFIFECCIYDKDAVILLQKLPQLIHLGFKIIGNVIKKVRKFDPKRTLNLAYIDNTGSKTIRLTPSGLRCKKSLLLLISEVCPNAQHFKLRVKDDDVVQLCTFPKIKTVELIFNTGTPTSPFEGTASFLKIRGMQLSSVAILCNYLTHSTLITIAANCRALTSLWCRCNYFSTTQEFYTQPPPDMNLDHEYLQELKILYFRVGMNELSVPTVPPYVLHYLTRNSKRLSELIIVLRANFVNDLYVTDLFIENDLRMLNKALFIVPGANNLPNIIPLTINTLHFILKFCPGITKVGNLLSWTINQEKKEVEMFVKELKKSNYDVEIVNKEQY